MELLSDESVSGVRVASFALNLMSRAALPWCGVAMVKSAPCAFSGMSHSPHLGQLMFLPLRKSFPSAQKVGQMPDWKVTGKVPVRSSACNIMRWRAGQLKACLPSMRPEVH